MTCLKLELTWYIGDMHRAAAKAKDVLPYRGAGAESEGKKIGQETGAKVDSAVSRNTFTRYSAYRHTLRLITGRLHRTVG